ARIHHRPQAALDGDHGEDLAMNERLARLGLVALVLLGPLVLGVKLFGDAPSVPEEARAAKASLIVITASTWPEGPVSHPALEALELRAGSVREFRSPS